MLHVRLIGDFGLRGEGGRAYKLRSVRARALLGMLCLTPERQRTRRWIEARLWSDRAPEQASGSLRQVLAELRTALGPAAAALLTDRDAVALQGVQTDLDTDPEAARRALAEGADLLGGIDLRDRAYQSWLAEQRARLAPDPPKEPQAALVWADAEARPLPFVIRSGDLPQGFAGFVPRALADAIGALVSEFAAVEVFGGTGAVVHVGPQERGLVLSVEAAEQNGRLHVMTTLGVPGSGQRLWSRQAVLMLDQGDLIAEGTFPGIVFEAAEQTLAAMPRLLGSDPSPLRAEALIARAVREMFSFDAVRLRGADALLAEAGQLQPTPKAFAWRGVLRQIMAVERTETDRAPLFAEAEEYARRALEGPAANPLVLALVSQVRVMLDNNVESGAALARDSLALSPHNAFAHMAQAGSLMRMGRISDAVAAARHGARLAERSEFLPWWQSLSGITLLAAGDFPGAIAALEAARTRSPKFRSPLRHLLYLYLETGQTEKAMRVMQELLALEPDFSLRRVREDPHYPAGTLRRTRLLSLSFPEAAE